MNRAAINCMVSPGKFYRRQHLRALAMLLAALATLVPLSACAQNSGPARDKWQHPEEVMDALGLRRGNVVADIGCGKGYFVFHFADRVGPAGRVEAEDVKQSALSFITDEAAREGLHQIAVIQGTPDDPYLAPHSLDVAFAMDTYHEWHEHASMLRHIFLALKPGGIVGDIDGVAPTGLPRAYYYQHHRMPESLERAEVAAAGFRFIRNAGSFTRALDGKQFYFLIFEKPK